MCQETHSFWCLTSQLVQDKEGRVQDDKAMYSGERTRVVEFLAIFHKPLHTCEEYPDGSIEVLQPYYRNSDTEKAPLLSHFGMRDSASPFLEEINKV